MDVLPTNAVVLRTTLWKRKHCKKKERQGQQQGTHLQNMQAMNTRQAQHTCIHHITHTATFLTHCSQPMWKLTSISNNTMSFSFLAMISVHCQIAKKAHQFTQIISFSSLRLISGSPCLAQ
jgi:hypothetical protein